MSLKCKIEFIICETLVLEKINISGIIVFC